MELNDDFKQLIDDSTDEFFAYVGLMYYQGQGLPKDKNKAKMWLQKSFNLGVDWAGYKLFDILFKENSVDSIISVIMGRASKGNPEFQARIARAYRDGKGVEKDLNKAAEWMRKAADQNLGWAKNELFDILWRIGTPESYTEMIHVAMCFAESGNPHAMVRIARAYKDGHGVDRDLRKSFEWFKRTEESGVDWVMDEFAANILDIYDESYSHDDPAYNRVLFETMLRFAESGNPHAMVRVARAYKDGHGVDRDLRKSFEWFKRTEESGVDWVMDEFAANIPAMYDESYSHDDPAYNRVLLETMLRFAESGNPHAMVRVARAYKDGHGVDMDLKKTVEWIDKIKEPGQKHIRSNDFK